MTVNSFISHFNVAKWVRGDRNSFNAKYRTWRYRFFSVLVWIVLIPIKVLDLVGVFYLIDLVRRLIIKPRKLTKFEIREAKLIFGDSINFKWIRIKENSRLARVGARYANKKQLGFVLFNTVNFSRELDHEKHATDMAWMIHELTHVLQFHHIGVQYIIEALRAQHNAGYSYGGKEALEIISSMENFNLEQQADIVKHYYQALKKKEDVGLYLSFIQDLKEGKL